MDSVASSMGLSRYYDSPTHHVSVVHAEQEIATPSPPPPRDDSDPPLPKPVSWVCDAVECRIGTRDPVVFRFDKQAD